MITTTINNKVHDTWDNYLPMSFNSHAALSKSYLPWERFNLGSLVKPRKHRSEPIKLNPVNISCLTHPIKKKSHVCMNLPCFKQHTPTGVSTKPVFSPFEDDDNPDWHKFEKHYDVKSNTVSENDEIEKEIIL